MEPEDSQEAFLQYPWAASLLSQPHTVCRVPHSREAKSSTEDSLFAEILRTQRTIRACVCVYQDPSAFPDSVSHLDLEGANYIEEVSTLMLLGDGLNGHPGLLHGGAIAAVLDHGMEVLLSVNHHRTHSRALARLKGEKVPPPPFAPFTAELKTKYLRPVRTPGGLECRARYVLREGRKVRILAEVRQVVDGGAGASGGDVSGRGGEEVVCAVGEALFVEPKPRASQL